MCSYTGLPLPQPSTIYSLTIYIHTVLHCVSNCSPVVQFLRVVLVLPYPPETHGTSTTANRQQQLQREGQGQPSQLPRNTTGLSLNPSHPSETSYRDLCGVLMWDPLHQYWTTNSVLLEDVNMGVWGGSEGGWVREGVGVG